MASSSSQHAHVRPHQLIFTVIAGVLVTSPAVAVFLEYGTSQVAMARHVRTFGPYTMPAYVVGVVATLIVLNALCKARAWQQGAMVVLGLPLAYLCMFVGFFVAAVLNMHESEFEPVMSAVSSALHLMALGWFGGMFGLVDALWKYTFAKT